MYLFIVFFAVPLNILLNEIIIAFCDQETSILSVHEVYEGQGGMVVATPHPEAPVHFSLVENISINIINISI
jgi:hypothetical protein